MTPDCDNRIGGRPVGAQHKGVNIAIETSDCDITSEGDPKGLEGGLTHRKRVNMCRGVILMTREGLLCFRNGFFDQREFSMHMEGVQLHRRKGFTLWRGILVHRRGSEARKEGFYTS